jgi:tetratricopeptide (TPR) repeat protein
MCPFRSAPTLLLALVFAVAPVCAQTPAALTSPEERAGLHSGPEWASIAPHLPDPRTGSAAQLETAADVLRARRFPEDALDYYQYAVQRGGNVTRLLNKMGVVRLELRQDDLARQMFLRVVRVNKKDGQGWNNLGVTEYSDQHYDTAINDYRKAIRWDHHSAVYHANLGMAYFEKKDMASAQQELRIAVTMDPGIMRARENGGVTAHVVGSKNYPELCFQLARMYARQGQPDLTREWLAKASEGGLDVVYEMQKDAALRLYLNDARVKLMLANAEQMRKQRLNAAAAKAPSLGAPANEHRVELN